jgi:type IV secretory pathway protease TraF
VSADRFGREIPRWNGCKTLAPDEVFLLSTHAADSFDGRYFGPTSIADIIEKVAPLWTF